MGCILFYILIIKPLFKTYYRAEAAVNFHLLKILLSWSDEEIV
jgi:hypothetical protein